MRLRAIFLVLALLAFFISSTGGYLYYSNLKASAYREAYVEAVMHVEITKNRVATFLGENFKLAKALSGLTDLRSALRFPDSESLQRASNILNLFSKALPLESCYLMDMQGKIVAWSDCDGSCHHAEQAHLCPPYFRQSIDGSPAVYMALEIGTKNRHIYFSFPVHGNDETSPIGVLAIKASVKRMESEFSHLYEEIILLTDPNEIVFVSTREDLLYDFLWKTSFEKASLSGDLRELEALPWRWTGLEKTDQNHAVDAYGNEFLVHQTEVAGFPGWTLVSMMSLDAVYRRISAPLIKTTGYAVLFVSVFVGILVLLLYRKASLEILQRKTAEGAQHASELRYRAIVEDQTELVSRFRPDGTLTFVNDAYCRFFGETPGELVGYKFWHLVSEKDRDSLKRHVSLLGSDQPVTVIEYRVLTSTGEVRWQQWTHRAILDDKGHIIEIQAVGRDVTERRCTEEALKESERQLRFLSSQLLTAQENERKRISRELHDSIGSSLSAIKYGLESTLHQLEGKTEVSSETVTNLISITQHTIDEARRMMTDLRPSMLDDLGILATLGWFLRQFQSVYTGIPVEKEFDIEESDIPEQLKIVIFRIVQEAFHNITKYSKADKVWLSLKNTGERVELTIGDNGIGFDVESVLSGNHRRRGGLGLTSMRERTELSGGSFSVRSIIGQETRILAAWPVVDEAPLGEA